MSPSAERLPTPIPESRALELAVEPFGISDVKQTGFREIEGMGTVTDFRFSFDDGSRYPLRQYQPLYPKLPQNGAETAPPLIRWLSWLTSLNGLNDDSAIRVMDEGIPVLATGLQELEFSDVFHVHRAINFDHDVSAHQQMLDYLHKERGIDTSKIVAQGESRGADGTLATAATAAEHNRAVVYAEMTELVLEHRPTRDELDLFQTAAYFAQELKSGGFSVASNFNFNIFQFLKTVPLTPKAILQDTAVGFSLFGTSDIGKYVRALPNDLQGHATFFKGSLFNHSEDFIATLGAMPNLTVNEVDGVHLHIFDRSRLDPATTRAARAAWHVSEGHDLSKVDLNQPVRTFEEAA